MTWKSLNPNAVRLMLQHCGDHRSQCVAVNSHSKALQILYAPQNCNVQDRDVGPRSLFLHAGYKKPVAARAASHTTISSPLARSKFSGGGTAMVTAPKLVSGCRWMCAGNRVKGSEMRRAAFGFTRVTMTCH